MSRIEVKQARNKAFYASLLGPTGPILVFSGISTLEEAIKKATGHDSFSEIVYTPLTGPRQQIREAGVQGTT